MVYVYSGVLFSHEKEQNSVICNKMDESLGHYAEWNKPYRERQIPCVALMWCSLMCSTT